MKTTTWLIPILVAVLCSWASGQNVMSFYVDQDNCNDQAGASHPGEWYSNEGGATSVRVKASDHQWYGDWSDDDIAAMAAKLQGYADAGYTLYGPGKDVAVLFRIVPAAAGWSQTGYGCVVHLCALWSETDWTEGDGPENFANFNWNTPSAATEMYAQTVHDAGVLDVDNSVAWQFPGETRSPWHNTMLDCVWTKANRYEWDLAGQPAFPNDLWTPWLGECKTVQNSTDAIVKSHHEGAYYDIPMDEALVTDLLTNENNRGLAFVHLPPVDTQGTNNFQNKKVRCREWSDVTSDPSILIAILGDANGDDYVDGADYTLWADNYNPDFDPEANPNQTPVWEKGDFNQDQVVDGADYTLWADHYQWGTPVQAVPEPTVLALLAAAAGLIRRRRRQ